MLLYFNLHQVRCDELSGITFQNIPWLFPGRTEDAPKGRRRRSQDTNETGDMYHYSS